MEENQPKTGKYALRFGLLLGLVSIVFSIMLFTMDMHYEQNTMVQIVSLILAAAAISLGVSQFKKDNGGFLKLSEALKIGTGIALVAGILGLLYFFIQSSIIEPDYWDKAYEIGKQKALQDNPSLTEEQVDQGIEMQKKFKWLFYPIGLIINIIVGLVLGLIIGLIMKKQKPSY
ncbi:DUF4199 domain-containing protein [Ulvibacterium sp.]|uniref:DUF4199 domain-containing protein n=1 Tax=Ulvibacterium sp. TaxID=2665914 RepID=UPI00260D557D|nr:DUF4199 domain-containing protein [Ulvibacterium sp.]